MASDDPGVQLAGSATNQLHAALGDTIAGFPSVFTGLDVPADPADFKKTFASVLPVFEAMRAASPDRSAIARHVVDQVLAGVVVEPGSVPITDAIAQSCEPFDLETWSPGGDSRLRPAVPLEGRALSGTDLVTSVDALVARGSASSSVAAAVSRLVDDAGDDGLDLRGTRIVVLGAGAELAPTRLWLDGGADVLWVDLDDPPVELLERTDLGGTLHWVAGGVDLLTDPHRVRATIETFADGSPVDLGLYAYAPGRGREWRLTATMNAIVDALGAHLVRSVAVLVSPTTCGLLTADDLALEARRLEERPRWQRMASAARLLGRDGGHADAGTIAANRGIVTIQGGSYQTAQYVGKLLTAEAWATGDRPIAVSANTAGISLTESLHHPVFDIAFAGASALGVETFDPATTAALNGLLTLHDRLHPRRADAGVDDLFSTRVHGGIYALPYPIDPALRVAAAVGVLKDPRRLVGLLRG